MRRQVWVDTQACGGTSASGWMRKKEEVAQRLTVVGPSHDIVLRVSSKMRGNTFDRGATRAEGIREERIKETRVGEREYRAAVSQTRMCPCPSENTTGA